MDFLDLKTIWFSKEEFKRRKNVEELLKIYSNDWADILKYEIVSLFTDKEEASKLCSRADISLNILRWAVDTLSSIYSKRVHRSLLINGEPAEVDGINSAQLDMALDQAAKMMFLCREVFVRPYWEDEKIVVDICTPDKVAVVLDSKNHRKMAAIAIKTNKTTIHVWTEEMLFILDSQWNLKSEEINEYGIIPWVDCHANYPLHRFFNDRESEGLKRATIQAGVAKTDYNHLRHIQSFKQLHISGASREEQKTLKLGPSDALMLQDPNADIGVLDLQANLSEHLESLLSSVAATLNLYGIRPEQVRGTLNASSGYALEIQMHETEKEWQHQRQMWRFYEQRIYKVASMIRERQRFVSLPEGDLEIDFPDIGPTSNPQDEIDYYIKNVNNGLMSKSTAMKRHHGYTEEEAQAEIQRIKDEQNAFSPMGADIFNTGGGGNGLA